MIRVDQLMSCSTCEGSAQHLNVFHKSRISTICRLPSSAAASLRRTRSIAAGSTQCLNGAPLRKVPGLHRLFLIAGMGMLALLTACGEGNRFVAPPLPTVIVQLPVQQTVTPYREATGNAASVNTV